MDFGSLVDVINENALLISELIAREIDQLEPKHEETVDDRLYSLCMFYRAAILVHEGKAGGNEAVH